MTDAEFEELRDEVRAIRIRQAERRAVMHAICDAPEAEGRRLLAFAIAATLDADAGSAISLLREAPTGLATLEEVFAWLARVPPQPTDRTAQ